MPVEAIHASAVAIAGEALLIRGPSRAGKSQLACALIARAARGRPITLIGDDRILLHRGAGGLVARPHPRIAGFLDCRGLGIVAMPWTGQAEVGGIVDLGERRGEAPRGGEHGGSLMLPHLEIVEPREATSRAEIVLAWWAARGAARATPGAESGRRGSACAKD